jgi:hypothetical protein
MTLIGNYTTRILKEMSEFKFDTRETSDLSNAISQHLADFEEDVKARNNTLRKLSNLNNVR